MKLLQKIRNLFLSPPQKREGQPPQEDDRSSMATLVKLFQDDEPPRGRSK